MQTDLNLWPSELGSGKPQPPGRTTECMPLHSCAYLELVAIRAGLRQHRDAHAAGRAARLHDQQRREGGGCALLVLRVQHLRRVQWGCEEVRCAASPATSPAAACCASMRCVQRRGARRCAARCCCAEPGTRGGAVRGSKEVRKEVRCAARGLSSGPGEMWCRMHGGKVQLLMV